MMRRNKIGIIGGGNMGQAILNAGLKNKNLDFLICEKRREAIQEIKKRFGRYLDIEFKDIYELVLNSEVVILAVKPQDIKMVLQKISHRLKLSKKNLLIIS
ncbi:MAG: NAD(P)-binding domain-containing protein, partial [Candidatus Omnitrophica bacterium]|nr:NAD(P)-binding domain-containing protein [Candidatus Omnitrophota bacterium]